MPPHCDTLDGPVVKAAMRALAAGNVNLILPYVPKEAEHELEHAFAKTLQARQAGGKARELADYWFFETAVRLHRAGEGAPYTGLKPAGLDEGPVVPRAEKGIASGNPSELIEFLNDTVKQVIENKFHRVLATRDYDENDVPAARESVEASLGLTLFAHGLYTYLTASAAHGAEGTGGHQH